MQTQPFTIRVASDIYSCAEIALYLLGSGHPVRPALEQHLAQEVEDSIGRARAESTSLARKVHVELLLNSMLCTPNATKNSFSQWKHRLGIALGTASCHEIGMRVCTQNHFTVGEARKILNDTKWREPVRCKHFA